METLTPARATVQHQPPKQKAVRTATLQRQCACGGETHGAGECEQCRRKRERTLQRASYGGLARARGVPQVVHEVLERPGHPLDERTRVTMESRFGRDFSSVRLHHDSTAASAARSVDARAFTVGEHVVFGAGQFALTQSRGRRLVAHELAHVVQQRGATPAAGELSVSTDEHAEMAADRAAARAMNGLHVGNVGVTQPYSAQREEEKSVFGTIASKVSSGVETLAIKSIATPARVVSPIAGRLVEAMLWGMLDEYKVQSPDRGAQAWERVKEAAESPLVFLKNYWWGLIKGIFSPITGLFDLAKLAVKLQYVQAQLMASAWKNREAIAEEAGNLASRLETLGALGRKAIKGMSDNPIATMKALDGWLTSLGDAAEQKARSAGHDVMKSLMGTLDKPMHELAEVAGEIVGTVLINIVLLVFTAGIGDAIAQIAARLGELGSYLGKLGEAAAMVGKLVGKISELLGVVGGWITKAEGVIAQAAEAVLKPVSPLLKELGNLVGGLRNFLRKFLGLADEAATTGAETAAGAVAKKLEGQAVTSGPPKLKVVEPPKIVEPPVVEARGPIRGVIQGEGASTTGPAGKLRSIKGGKENIPLPSSEANESVLAATGTDDALAATPSTSPNLRLVEPAPVSPAVPEPTTAMAGGSGTRPPRTSPARAQTPSRTAATQRGGTRTGGRGSRVEQVERDIEAAESRITKQSSEVDEAKRVLGQQVQNEYMPPDTKVTPVKTERTSAGRGQSRAVTPEDSPVGMDVEYRVDLPDSSRSKLGLARRDPANPQRGTIKFDGIEPQGSKFKILEHKEVEAAWEHSHFGRDQQLAEREIDEILNRHVAICDEIPKCAGVTFSSNNERLVTLMNERISILPKSVRARVSFLAVLK